MNLCSKLLHRQTLGNKAVSLQANGRHQRRLRTVGDKHHTARRVFKQFDVLKQRHADVTAVEIDKHQIRVLISGFIKRVVSVMRDTTHRTRDLFANQLTQSSCKKRALVKDQNTGGLSIVKISRCHFFF